MKTNQEKAQMINEMKELALKLYGHLEKMKNADPDLEIYIEEFGDTIFELKVLAVHDLKYYEENK